MWICPSQETSCPSNNPSNWNKTLLGVLKVIWLMCVRICVRAYSVSHTFGTWGIVPSLPLEHLIPILRKCTPSDSKFSWWGSSEMDPNWVHWEMRGGASKCLENLKICRSRFLKSQGKPPSNKHICKFSSCGMRSICYKIKMKTEGMCGKPHSTYNRGWEPLAQGPNPAHRGFPFGLLGRDSGQDSPYPLPPKAWNGHSPFKKVEWSQSVGGYNLE